MRRSQRNSPRCLVIASALSAYACDDNPSSKFARPLSILKDERSLASAEPVPEDRLLGAVARSVPIRSRPAADASVLGLLTAGAVVKRADTPIADRNCSGGWFAVSPRGYVCANERTTTDPRHPTLQARGLAPDLSSVLPYPYASTQRRSTSYEPDPRHQDGVREHGSIGKGVTFAVVGSWNTLDEYDQRQQLAMLTLGVFVPTRDIKPITAGASAGSALDESMKWPVGLPLTPKLPTYRISADQALPEGRIESPRPIALSSKSRTLGGQRYFRNSDTTYVSESDVIVVRRRTEFPEFVDEATHWMDVDSTHGVVVLYQGERPTYVTRTCALPERPWPRGTARVKSKQVTDLGSRVSSDGSPLNYDTPWVVELDSGVTIHARVGQSQDESSAQSRTLCLHAEDARRVFQFLLPELPPGWHAVHAEGSERQASPVLIR